MSKKKNTLKDLDEFLKQQAATLVSPASLSDKVTKKEEKSSSGITKAADQKTEHHLDPERIKLCNSIIQTLEGKSSLEPEDIMLINTALYIKHGENWKEAVRSYWKGR